MRSFIELEREAKKNAALVRAEAGIGNDPISDIFHLIEGLDILYVRYPASEEVVEGYAARRGGRRVIFTNSSYGQGKEVFTAAHELGHLYMDLSDQSFIVDEKVSFDDTIPLQETRANAFAANFLMPESAVFGFVRDRIGVEPDAITAKHVVWFQHHFQVSYQAALIRLKTLGLISKRAFENAVNYGGYATLSELVKKCGYDNCLLTPNKGIGVPPLVIGKVIELYENEKIPLGSLNYFLGLIGKTAEEFGIQPVKTDGEETDE